MDKQVSFDDEPLILVDSEGRPVGSKSKLQCHLGEGILHKAFSVFIFNSGGQVLLQKRSEKKLLWPSYWSNSCCSHPRVDEDEVSAVHRRISEELGIAVNGLARHFDFEYRARYGEIGSEWERCSVFTARSDREIDFNSNEIENIRWVAKDDLAEILRAEADSFTPWIKLEWNRLSPLVENA